MHLVLDVGNTNIKTGLFENGKLRNSWRFATNLKQTADEYGIKMEAFLTHLGLSTLDIEGVMISSVIPSINYTMEHMCRLYFKNAEVKLLNCDMNLGLKIKYDYPSALGTDRICNAVAAYTIYGGPCIVVDFGTATNFSVISREGEFLGGVICPGIMVSADALTDKAAMLHKVEYVKPDKIVCSNTKDAVQAGVINGYVGQVDYIIRKIEQEMQEEYKVVATGGFSSMITSETDCIDIVDPTLTLKGLEKIYEMNR
ncbi:MAG: type III pantothenate kinase [Clostridia bacterium]|nr:type III pantothenate kinase [Clostridia bacterium]